MVYQQGKSNKATCWMLGSATCVSKELLFEVVLMCYPHVLSACLPSGNHLVPPNSFSKFPLLCSWNWEAMPPLGQGWDPAMCCHAVVLTSVGDRDIKGFLFEVRPRLGGHDFHSVPRGWVRGMFACRQKTSTTWFHYLFLRQEGRYNLMVWNGALAAGAWLPISAPLFTHQKLEQWSLCCVRWK